VLNDGRIGFARCAADPAAVARSAPPRSARARPGDENACAAAVAAPSSR
jgi:hypothetical protein